VNDIEPTNLIRQTIQDFFDELNEKLTTLIRQAIQESFNEFKQKPEQEWFSVEETAAIVGVESKHIRRAIDAGKLVPADITLGSDGRAFYRISRQDINDWMDATKIKRVSPKSTRQAMVSVGNVKDYFSNAPC
jgi:hypothetical protein